ncbi:hypothetical protein ACFLQV_03065 [Calditrichota bacterium]
MRFRSLIAMALMVAFIIGCGGSRQTGLVSEANKETMKNIPKWYLNPPSDDDFIFATGTATSRDLQTANDKAKQTATMQIGQTIETRFEGLSKRFQEEVGSTTEAQYLDQFTSATKAVVSTTLSGVVVDEAEIYNENGLFRSYVLLKMPIGATSQALMDRIKQQEQLYTRFRSTEVFNELNAETEKFENWKKGE